MRPCHSHYASQLGAWAGRRRTDRGTAHKIPGDPLLPAGPALRPCPYHVASATRTRFRLEKGTTYSCMRGAWSGTQKSKKKKKTVQFIRVTEKQAVCAFGIVGGRLDGRGRPARHSCSGGVAPITARRPCLASVHPSLELSSMNDELISKPRRGRGGVSIGWGRGRGRASLLLLLPAGERRRHAPRSTRCCTSREGRAARLLVLADGGGRRRRRQLRSLSSISHPRPG